MIKTFFNKRKFEIKVIMVFIASFFLSGFLGKTVFIAYTPRINEFALRQIKDYPGLIITKSSAFIASLGNNRPSIPVSNQQNSNIFNKLSSLPTTQLKSITKGVYAQEDKENNTVYIRVTQDAEWEEKQIMVNGKITILRFPKGTFK